jgi:hypothetical protein
MTYNATIKSGFWVRLILAVPIATGRSSGHCDGIDGSIALFANGVDERRGRVGDEINEGNFDNW